MSTGKQQAQLSYNELYQTKWLLGNFLALVSLITVFTIDVSVGLVLGLTVVTILAVTLVPRLPAFVPPIVWKAATPALVLIVIADFMMSLPDILPPLLRLILLLLILRSIQYRSKREDWQQILIALFVIIVSGVLTLDLGFALQIVIFTPSAMLILFLLNLSEMHKEDCSANEDTWDDYRPFRLLRRLWGAMDGRLLSLSMVLFVGMVVLSSIVFVSLPRLGLNQAIPFLDIESRSRSGFSDELSLGDVADIIEDNRVAFRVDISDNTTIPSIPYWRMVVLDHYLSRPTNSKFVTSKNVKAHDKPQTLPSNDMPRPHAGSADVPEGEADWTFYLEGGISRYLPLPGVYDEIEFQRRKTLTYSRVVLHVYDQKKPSKVFFYQLTDVNPAPVMPMMPADAPLRGWAAVRSRVDPEPVFVTRDEALGRGNVSISYPRTTVMVPADSEDYLLDLAQQLKGDEDLDAANFARRVTGYLAENHTYSLQSQIPSGDGDPVVRWLQNNTSGHCELFASAFTLIARSAGYPCRVVGGFKGGVWNEVENYFMVRNSDAHAWCEIWTGDSWLRIDPTPGSSNASGLAGDDLSSGLFSRDSSWRAHLDSLRILWYRRVVNFDESAQEELASDLKDSASHVLNALQTTVKEKFEDFRNWVEQPWTPEKGRRLIGYLLIAVGLVFAAYIVKKMIQKVLERGRFLGVRIKHDPIKKKAGQLVHRFRQKQPDDFSQTRVTAEQWEMAYLSVARLRYGTREHRPDSKPIFQNAKHVLRLAGKRA